jgi:hypothetical protein
MHPAEIVCIVTSSLACLVCCFVAGRGSRRKQPQMIDFDTPPAGFRQSQNPVQIPAATGISGSQNLRQIPMASSGISLGRSHTSTYSSIHSVPGSSVIEVR